LINKTKRYEKEALYIIDNKDIVLDHFDLNAKINEKYNTIIS
jgi:type IV secretory pathway VirB4 component